MLHLPLTPGPGGGLPRVAPGANLAGCLRRFCRDEIVSGVECARCSLRAAVGAAAASAGAAAALRATQEGGGGGEERQQQQQEQQEQQQEQQQQQQQKQQARWEQPPQEQEQRPHQPAGPERQLQPAPQARDQAQCQGGGATAPTAAAVAAAAARLGLPLLQALATASGPLPPIDLREEALALGLPWLPRRARVAKRCRVGRAAPARVLHQQRTAHGGLGGQRKLQGHVAFPLKLDMGPSMVGAPEGGASCNVPAAWAGSTTGSAAGGGGGGGWQAPGGAGAQLEAGAGLLGLRSLRVGAGGLALGALGGVPGGGGGGMVRGPGSGNAAAAAGGSGGTGDSPERGGGAAGAGGVERGGGPEAPSPDNLRGGGMIYDLVAVVQHLGWSSASGHYVVFRRLRDPRSCAHVLQPGVSGSGPARGACSACCGSGGGGGQWVRISDASVEAVGTDDVLRCDATLLLYERRACSKAPLL